MTLRWTEKFPEKLMSCWRTSRILCNLFIRISNKPITKFYITCWRILVFCANWKLWVKPPTIPIRGPWTSYSDKEKFLYLEDHGFSTVSNLLLPCINPTAHVLSWFISVFKNHMPTPVTRINLLGKLKMIRIIAKKSKNLSWNFLFRSEMWPTDLLFS